jgi:electron transfer flavoprotein alpha subunit
MSPGILVSSEHDNGIFELLTKGRELAKQLGLSISALAFGNVDDKKAHQYFEYGAHEITAIPNIDPSSLDAETYAHALFEVTKDNGPDILLITSSKLGKETAGRIAQKLQAGCATDAINLSTKDSALVIERYSLGGNTVSTEIIKTKKKVVSIMPRTFEANPAPVTGKVTAIDIKPPPQRVQVVERRKKTGEAVSIESAENLVCVGQGIGKKEDLAMINELCTALKAELGCTRALSSDFHWLSEDRMVGISGKRCKPKLHVSIGISGQIQHTVGIMKSKLIVAINKDKEAPILKIADYGIVGDLYQTVPKLTETIKSVGP